MTITLEKSVKVPDRAMIYHQGLPVAVCPVATLEAEFLQLIYGPFRFERKARLRLQFLDPDSREGAQRMGIVEEVEEHRMRVRLEPGTA